MPDRELIATYFISIAAAQEIVRDGTIRHVAATRGASQKALNLLESAQITYAIIINYQAVPKISAKPMKLATTIFSHEYIVHGVATALSGLGFPARIKDFYNPGADIEEFQLPRFWRSIEQLRDKFTQK